MSEQPAVHTGFVAPQDVRDDDGLLDFTTRRRMSFADSITIDDKQDPKMLALYLKSLDGIDKTAMGRKRLKVDEKANETDKHVAGSIVELLKAVGSNNPFTRAAIESRGKETATDANIPAAELPEIEFAPGETVIGTERETFADFAKKFPEQLK